MKGRGHLDDDDDGQGASSDRSSAEATPILSVVMGPPSLSGLATVSFLERAAAASSSSAPASSSSKHEASTGGEGAMTTKKNHKSSTAAKKSPLPPGDNNKHPQQPSIKSSSPTTGPQRGATILLDPQGQPHHEEDAPKRRRCRMADSAVLSHQQPRSPSPIRHSPKSQPLLSDDVPIKAHPLPTGPTMTTVTALSETALGGGTLLADLLPGPLDPNFLSHTALLYHAAAPLPSGTATEATTGHEKDLGTADAILVKAYRETQRVPRLPIARLDRAAQNLRASLAVATVPPTNVLGAEGQNVTPRLPAIPHSGRFGGAVSTRQQEQLAALRLFGLEDTSSLLHDGDSRVASRASTSRATNASASATLQTVVVIDYGAQVHRDANRLPAPRRPRPSGGGGFLQSVGGDGNRRWRLLHHDGDDAPGSLTTTTTNTTTALEALEDRTPAAATLTASAVGERSTTGGDGLLSVRKWDGRY